MNTIADLSSTQHWRETTTMLQEGDPWHSFVEPYSSPLPSVFLYKVSELRDLDLQPVWLARDGLISLAYFFDRYPEPMGLKTKLLVEETWAELIPPKWQKQTSFYKIACCPHAELLDSIGQSVPIEYLLAPLVNSTVFATKTGISTQLSSLSAEQVSLDLKLIFEPSLADLAWGVQVGKEFGSNGIGNIDFISAYEAKCFSDLRGHLYLDLNEKLICADDSYKHYALANGARFGQMVLENVDFHRLSPYHGIVEQKKNMHTSNWPQASEVIALLKKDPAPTESSVVDSVSIPIEYWKLAQVYSQLVWS